MAIENIPYVYDHTSFYRRALRPVKNQFCKLCKTNIKERQQKEINLKLARKRCGSRKAKFGPSKNV